MPELRYADALNQALREEMARDDDVIVLGEDVAIWGDGGGVFGVTRGLYDEFGPSRVRDTPISEEAFVAIAVGAAATGLRPVVELMFADFLTFAMEPLVNQAAKLRYMSGGQAEVRLVVRTNLGASFGKAAQHSQSLETWVAHVPGLRVAVPTTPADAKAMLKFAIRDNNPVIFFEHKLLYFQSGDVPEGEELLPFGQAAVRRQGEHLTIVATHTMLLKALAIADGLSGHGIEIEVVDPRTLVPLDIDTIVASVRKTNRLLICHEAVEQYGWAGEIAMQVMDRAFDDLDGPIVRVCGGNLPHPYSEPLEATIIPDETSIEQGIRRVLQGSGLTLP
jgi:pyruvate dehydrogenase E1 component beta subunit